MAGSNLTSTLSLKLFDDVSKPARSVSQALRDAERAVQDVAKGLANTGATDRFVSSLSKIKVGAKDINTVAQAWKDYSKSAGLAANSADWTKAQASSVRQWESQTISALRKVKAEQIAFNRSISGAGGAGVSPMMAQMSANAIANQRMLSGMGTPAMAAAVAAKAGGGINMGALGAMGGMYAGYKAQQFASEGITAYRQYSDVNAIMKPVGELTAAQQERLKAQQRALGVESRYSPVKIAEAQKLLIERNVPKEFVEAYTRNAVAYASALNIDLPEAVKTLEANIFSTSKLKGVTDPAQAEKVMQRVASKSTRMGKMGMTNEDISGFFEYGGLSGTQAGISDDTMMAMATLMKKQQIAGDKAGVAMRAIAAKSVSPTAKGLDALAAMGVNWDQFTKMPDAGLSGKSLAKVIGGRFGKRLSDDQIARLDALKDKTVTDEKGEQAPLVGDRTEYVMQAMEIFAESFEKNKKGVMKAKDANELGKALNTFYKMSIESVDTEGLLRAIMSKKASLAQLNAFFGFQQGSRAGAALMNKEDFEANRKKLAETPLDLHLQLAAERLASFDGAVKQLEGSIETLQISVAEAFDNYGKGNGAMTEFVRALTSGTNALIALPDPLKNLGTEAVVLGGAFVALRAAGVFATSGFGGLVTAAGAVSGALLPLAALIGSIVALYKTVAPQPLNAGEDEFARQKKYGLTPRPTEPVTPGAMNRPAGADHPSIRYGHRGSTPFTPGAIPLSGAAAARGADYSIGHMQPEFRTRLEGLMAEAKAAGVPLAVSSGYRDEALQAKLYAASHGSGMVARPGRSQHGKGIGADLRGDLAWAHAHAAKYGLNFPYIHGGTPRPEPWHIGINAREMLFRRHEKERSHEHLAINMGGAGPSSIAPTFDHGPIVAYRREVQGAIADLQKMHEMTVRPSVRSSRLGGMLGKVQRGHFTTAGVQGD
jgi:hypothetical protein